MRPLLYILLLSVLWPGIVNAAVVDNLYQARVPVKDHSTRQLGRATRAGLAQVLVKVSGNREILGHEEVRQALDQSQKFMQQYQYRRQP